MEALSSITTTQRSKSWRIKAGRECALPSAQFKDMPFSHPDVRVAAIEQIASKWDGRPVLDIGIGNGFYGEELHRRFNAIVYGVEVWPAYIVNQLLYYRTIFVCDARTFEYEMLKGKVGLVIMGDILEHLEKAEAVTLVNRLKELFPRLILTIPIVDVYQGTYKGNVYENHHYRWKTSEIKDDLGFKLIKDCTPCGLFEWRKPVIKDMILNMPGIIQVAAK